MRFFLHLFGYIAVCFIIIISFFGARQVFGDDLDAVTKQLNDLRTSLQSSQQATQTNEQTLSKLQAQLDEIKRKITVLEADIAQKEADIKKGEQALTYQKKLLEERTVSYYKNAQSNTVKLTDFIFSNNLSESLRNFFYQKSLVDEDKKNIVQIVLYVKAIEDRKKILQGQKDRLAVIKKDVDQQSSFLAAEVTKAKKYETQLSQQIAVLTAKQQQLLAQKLASLNIPQSAYNTQGGCSNDLTNGKDPGFSPRFGFFTYGVPNRIGLNQYGAKGRADAGQNAQTIVQAYYNADYKTGYSTDINIHVVGSNEYGQSFDENWKVEDYLKHLYEMPTNWPMEALKAQAIAARSYVLAVTNNGSSSVCPSQQCQVVKKEENSDKWKQAVKDTAGIVLVNGGQPIKAWFSSTHGGYVFTSGDIGWNQTAWTKRTSDVSSGVNSFDDLKNNAYDKNSPWFYCDWGARSEYSKTAWLKTNELADIVNVLMLAKRDSSTTSHLSQNDKSNPDGTDTWDSGKVKDELRNRGGSPFSSIDSVNIDWDKGAGRTTSVRVNGDAGSVSFDGGEFKNYFNLRAPANIQIVGPLFNAEKR